MNDPSFASVETVFAAALERPMADRAAFLEKACANDGLLKARVEALLRAHDAMERSPESTATEFAKKALADLAARSIGRYRLLQPLGEGGCGTVYMAEQDEPVRRRVALKVIKPGMDTKEVIARFAAERQALAMMDHPNIAKVFDAGATETGRPFFVMELVRGMPITTYCEERKLSVAARLELFIQVCRAVQHAHQKGVIHRDIKPSNILVALHDDIPVPKIIDFGIAKAIAGPLADQAAFTNIGQFMGTPAYMSPEQAQLSVMDVDTRSDIYSLGVILYELLTGVVPFNAKQLTDGGIDEMRRRIREVEPPRPSTRIVGLKPEELYRTAERRQVSPQKLIKGVSGDLDWIVMRCIEKDRSRRYETANDLANDIGRHLADEPISACPPSAIYRLRKVVSRNRLAFAAGGVVALTLVAATAVSTWQAVRANRAEHLASNESAISHAVNEFLVSDLLQQADSRAQADAKATPKADLKVREALDRAGDKVGSRFAGQPLIEAAVRDAIGSAYFGVGDFAKAALHHERAFLLRKLQLGPEHPKTLVSSGALASAWHSQGKFVEAEALHAETLTIQKRVLGPEDPATLASMNNLAMAYFSQGKVAEAAVLFGETLEKRRRVLGPDHPNTLKSMNNLANAYRLQGNYVEAAALLAQTLEMRTRMLGVEHPYTLASMNNLALTYHIQGKFDEAIGLHRRTLEIRMRVMGAEHPDTLGTSNNLALAYAAAGNFSEAATLHAQTLEVQKRVLGAEHPHALASMNNLGTALNGLGRSAEAVELHRETLEVRKRVLGAEHPDTLLSMHNLAEAYASLRRLDDAVALHARTLEIRKRVLGSEHPDALTSMSSLASSYQKAGRLTEGVALFEETLKRRKAKLGDDHRDTRKSIADLEAAYTEAGRNAYNEPLLVESRRGVSRTR